MSVNKKNFLFHFKQIFFKINAKEFISLEMKCIPQRFLNNNKLSQMKPTITLGAYEVNG